LARVSAHVLEASLSAALDASRQRSGPSPDRTG
jgi:hypothetical protein